MRSVKHSFVGANFGMLTGQQERFLEALDTWRPAHQRTIGSTAQRLASLGPCKRRTGAPDERARAGESDG